MAENKLRTKIFLDSGDPEETRQALSLLGFLDGQTTNPSLVAKSPQAQNKDFSAEQAIELYRQTVSQISQLLPDGSVSVEVTGGPQFSAEELFEQGKMMAGWINNAHIKYPITASGLSAAEMSVSAGYNVNMTLCFSQEQAAAVYGATLGATRGQVFVSPFVGRLDDIGQDGTDLVFDIQKLYQTGDGHVEVLMASVRNLKHFLVGLKNQVDIITAPFSILKEWAEAGMPDGSQINDEDDFLHQKSLRSIAYQPMDLKSDWRSYDIHHDLTDKGLVKFTADWQSLIK